MLAQFVTHAERFGVEGVFEAAVDELDPGDLAALELRLRELDAKWRPPLAERPHADTREVEQGSRLGRGRALAFHHAPFVEARFGASARLGVSAPTAAGSARIANTIRRQRDRPTDYRRRSSRATGQSGALVRRRA
jgi:hypothetical protein